MMEMLTFGCPAALLAFMYPFYTRLFSVRDGMAERVAFGGLTPKRMGMIFTASDGLTFTAQVSGLSKERSTGEIQMC